MKNVTFRADGGLREWLGEYAPAYGSAKEVDALMKRLRHVQVGKALTRDEMNTR
jgi:hypothetical protein